MAVGTLSPPPPAPTRRRWLASRRRQVVAAGIILGALGFLAFQGLANATEYFKTADQAVADKAALGTSQFRIEGTVAPGIVHDTAGTEFDIVANNVSVRIVDSAQPPQLFKVGIPVVLEGHWQGQRLRRLPDHGETLRQLRRGPPRPAQVAAAGRQHRAVNAALGTAAVLLGLLGAVAGGVTMTLGVVRGRDRLMRTGRNYIFVVLLGAVVATIAMQHALISRDFTLQYVENNDSLGTPLLYRITAMWSDLQGSILLWALVLAGYLTAMALHFRRRVTDPLVAWASVVGFVVAAFFFGLMLTASNPFTLVSGRTPTDGAGPNPLLQDHILVAFHPPLLYLGLVGFTVPFCFAVASLITGRVGEGWMIETRRWTLFAWGFLTIGVVLGAWWSYQVLGWGGFWAWDPVENAAFIPWLTATAYIHSVMVQERRGMLRVWNLSLVLATFSLTILGTFLTRSGVLNSVHSFSGNSLGPILLTFFGLVVATAVGLLAWRGDRLRSPGMIDSPFSREGAFLANNLLFGAFALVVLLGTVFPLIAQAVNGSSITVGAPYFNQLTMPIMVCLLFLMAVAPVLPWRKASQELLRHRLQWPAATAAAVLIGCVAFGRAGSQPAVGVRPRRVRSRFGHPPAGARRSSPRCQGLRRAGQRRNDRAPRRRHHRSGLRRQSLLHPSDDVGADARADSPLRGPQLHLPRHAQHPEQPKEHPLGGGPHRRRSGLRPGHQRVPLRPGHRGHPVGAQPVDRRPLPDHRQPPRHGHCAGDHRRHRRTAGRLGVDRGRRHAARHCSCGVSRAPPPAADRPGVRARRHAHRCRRLARSSGRLRIAGGSAGPGARFGPHLASNAPGASRAQLRPAGAVMTTTAPPTGTGFTPDEPAPAPRRRLVLWIALGVAALLAAFVAVLATSGQAGQTTSGSPLIGHAAPVVSGPDAQGRIVSTAALKGRWVLVNFAASWCRPCQLETPQLLTFAARHTGPDAPMIVTVEYDERDLSSLRNFLASRHATWPVVDDQNAFVDYGSGGLPESYLLDPVGTVVAKVTGGVNADALDSVINSYSVTSSGASGGGS